MVERRATRLFGAIVLAGSALTAGCNRAPIAAKVDAAVDQAVSDAAFDAAPPAFDAAGADLTGCFVCPGLAPICPSPCPPDAGSGCWPCFV
jgi:hypothetical protein